VATLDMNGDSITAGYGVTAVQKFATLLHAHVSAMTLVNRGANGDMAADQAWKAFMDARAAGDASTIFCGVNDERIYGTPVGKRNHYIRFMRRLILDAVLVTKKLARTQLTKTGAWSNTQANSIGLASNSAGAKVSGVVNGSEIYIGSIIQSDPACVGSSIQVKVDGVIVGTFSCDGATSNMQTANGTEYSASAHRFAGFTDTNHTVELEVISTNGSYNYVDWIAGSGAQVGGRAFVANVIRMTAAGYAAYGGSDANVAAYNTALWAMVDQLIADGLRVHKVDLHSIINPATDLLPDGVHPNASGHLEIANAFWAAMDPYF
jgi:lysophospholipase L1-like esterase